MSFAHSFTGILDFSYKFVQNSLYIFSYVRDLGHMIAQINLNRYLYYSGLFLVFLKVFFNKKVVNHFLYCIYIFFHI